MIRPQALWAWAAVGCGFAIPFHSVSAQTISVDATQQVRTVDDRMFGINAVMWDGKTSDPQTVALVKAAGLRFIRIPGGSASDEYHWKLNRSLNNTWTWAASTADFVTLITSAHAQTTAVANYGTGTPEEAAAWVAYFNAPSNILGTPWDVAIGVDSKGDDWKTAGYWSALRAATPLGTDDGLNFLRLGRVSPVGVKYWEIGNENYGTWETDQQAVQHDPYTYANRAKVYIAKMKAVDPTVRIGLVSEPGEDTSANNTSHPATNPRTGQVHNGWTPVMLATLKSLNVTPDALIYHRYEQTPGRETDSGLLQAASTWSNDAKDLRQQLTDYLGAAGSGVELVVTENNSVYSDPGKQSTSVVNALYYADSLGNLLQTEFNGMAWWDLRNGIPRDDTAPYALHGNQSPSLYGWRQYGDYGIISTVDSHGSPPLQTSNFEPYPSYYVMKLLSHFARGGDAVVKATSSSTLLPAYAAKRQDGSVAVLVINKSPTADTTATISLAGITPATTGTIYSYGIPQDEAAHLGTGSTDVTSTSLPNLSTTMALTFAKYSASVLVIPPSTPPTIVVQPADIDTATGANVSFSVVASGTGLTYQWRKGGQPLAETSSVLSLSNVTAANAGSYDVVITNSAGISTTSAAAALTVSSASYSAPTSTMTNISTRAQVGVGDKAMIAGFTIGGAGAKKVLIRAVGPTLGAFGLHGTLVDPQLQVTTLQGAQIATNDDWGQGDAAAIKAAGDSVNAFGLEDGSTDAAMILTLSPGSYTAIVRGNGDSTGLAMVEVYDIDKASASRLTNLSTRAQVGTDSLALIGGVTVTGNRKVLIRGVGPTLSLLGVGGTLVDPQLAITTLSGAAVANNDDWGTPGDPNMPAAISATQAFGLLDGSKDAALILTLSDGLYTGTITGKNGGTGVGMIEVYEVP